MSEEGVRCLLISDFNIANFANTIANDQTQPLLNPVLAPFGRVAELLIDHSHECWRVKPGAVVIWTQPQAIIASFARLVAFESVSSDDLLLEVDQFSLQVSELVGRVDTVLVTTWVIPPLQRGLGMIDLTHSQGVSGALLAMNGRLVQNLRSVKGVFVLDAQRWVGLVGKAAFSSQMWYMAKVPFSYALFVEALGDIKAAISGTRGESRRLIILDLDDTLWGGVVGDIGWEGLKLGGHDPIGEAFVQFQQGLKALQKRGILLGIVSKNEEGVALEAMRKHPEMVLRPPDFAAWRINWNDKAGNIIDLTKELNLGLQSVVFIDDNPGERESTRPTRRSACR